MKVSIKQNKCSYYLKCIILFFFLYDVALNGFSTRLSSRKWAFIALFLIFLYKTQVWNIHRHVMGDKDIRILFCMEVIITFVGSFWVVWRADVNHVKVNGKTPASNGIYFILFSLLSAIFLCYVFSSLADLLHAIITISIWQSIFVFIEGSSLEFKKWLSSIIYNESIQYTTTNRASGLGAAGSWLSILLFLGVFSAGYFIITQKETLVYWFDIGIITVAQFFTGKTGIFLGIVVILYIIYIKSHKFRTLKIKALKYIIFAVFMTGILVMILSNINNNLLSELFTESLTRLFAGHAYITDTGGGFFGAFLGMKIPPLNEDTLFGYGISSGILPNGLVLRHDSGYIRRYMSDGLIMAFLEYTTLLVLLASVCNKISDVKLRKYVGLIIPCLFIIEIKEAYFYQYVAIAISFGILLIQKVESDKYRQNIVLKGCDY